MERRRLPRHRIDLPARFRIRTLKHPPRVSSFIVARVYDLSEIGVRLLSDQVLADGLHVLRPDYATSEHPVLDIEIEAGGAPLLLKGKVIWYDRTPPDSALSFEIGVEFADTDEDLRSRIRNLIRGRSPA